MQFFLPWKVQEYRKCVALSNTCAGSGNEGSSSLVCRMPPTAHENSGVKRSASTPAATFTSSCDESR